MITIPIAMANLKVVCPLAFDQIKKAPALNERRAFFLEKTFLPRGLTARRLVFIVRLVAWRSNLINGFALVASLFLLGHGLGMCQEGSA